MLRDDIKKLVEEMANGVADRVKELIERQVHEMLRPTKDVKKKAKAPASYSVTTGSDEKQKRKYTRTEKALQASRDNIAKARAARQAKIVAQKASETPSKAS